MPPNEAYSIGNGGGNAAAAGNAGSSGRLSRERYLQVVQTGIAAGQPRFAREAVLRWLAMYPGDLQAGLYYSLALLAEGRTAQARPVLAGLVRADPEYTAALEALQSAVPDPSTANPSSDDSPHAAALFALTGRPSHLGAAPEWGAALLQARRALDAGDVNAAGSPLIHALRLAPDQPVAAVCHLRFLALADAPLSSRLEAAHSYASRWSDNLACMLWLAHWMMENGEAAQAVALLHQAAARDVGGQVARRLWGTQHPYRSLWPERLERALDLPVPASVAAALGWNRLPATSSLPAESPAELQVEPLAEPSVGAHAVRRPSIAVWSGDEDRVAGEASIIGLAVETPESQPDREDSGPLLPEQAEIVVVDVEDLPQPTPPPEGKGLPPDIAAVLGWALDPESIRPGPLATAAGVGGAYVVATTVASQASVSSEAGVQSDEGIKPTPDPSLKGGEQPATDPSLKGGETPTPGFAVKGEGQDEWDLGSLLQSVTDELERLAGRVKLPGLGAHDGRFPVYVVFSTHNRLQAVYGARVADLIEAEMESLCQVVQRNAGWDARPFLADLPAHVLPLGLTPARPDDPWELKLALADLDASLAKRGERIGALLIVGGPEIVPFHHLPNPVDDQDMDVASDNPYATCDENYFIPEWPVGRLPGGAGGDARLLLDGLRRTRQYYERAVKRQPRARRWWYRLTDWLHSLLHNRRRSVGYTAAIWRQAAAAVFRPIGGPAALHVSPPRMATANPEAGAHPRPLPEGRGKSGVPSLASKLGYFNLHGLVDAPEWFGHRDPRQDFDGPDYPVALRPEDLQTSAATPGEPGRVRSRGRQAPQIVFSEACYGLHIQGRSVDQAISLKLLEAGCLAVAGSTCMAYGSIGTPLVAADLLGHTFWRNVQAGMPAGEALRQAKLTLAGEMNRRQGYLDGEDQKTLISFVLYGDPLAQAVRNGRVPKSTRYRSRPLARVKTVCDRVTAPDGNATPGAVVAGVVPAGAVSAGSVPAAMMASVKQVVSGYLPGMSDAQISYTREREYCNGKSHTCPTSQLDGKINPGPEVATAAPGAAKAGPGQNGARSTPGLSAVRSLITLSKQFHQKDGTHTEIARLTLDEQGQLLKLVVSR